MVPVDKLRNLGSKSAQWLAEIGVYTQTDLVKMGAVEAYWLLKVQGYPVNLNMLWALYGALHDIGWNELSTETKTRLKSEVSAMRFG